MIKLYLSGVETELKQIEMLLKHKNQLFGLTFSYLHIRNKPKLVERMRKLNADYHVRIRVNSGASTLENHSKNFIEYLGLSRQDYIDEYIEWLVANKDLYDCAYEFLMDDMEEDEIAELRERYIQKGLVNRMILLFTKAEGAQVLSDYKERGFEWISFLDTDNNDIDNAQAIQEADKLHLNVNLLSFANIDLNEVVRSLESIDTATWTRGSRLHEMFLYKNTTFGAYDVEKDTNVRKMIFDDDFWLQFTDDVKKYAQTKKSSHYRNMWNARELQNYINRINKQVPVNEDLLKKMGTNVPEELLERDEEGRLNTRALAAMANIKNGLHAVKLQKYALECNGCFIRDKCWAYKKDSVCAFTHLWREAGILNTRNQDSILKSMEDVISDQMSRLMQARFFENRSGGRIDKNITQLENDVLRNIDIFYKLKFGNRDNASRYQIINIGKNQMVAGDVESALKEVRESFPDEVASKIEKNVHEMMDAEDDGSTESDDKSE